ncbi:MAG: triose-phosphate isomerase [Armatimonadota bacterium]|nr:triose-phosphate isomerase [Armatimonadota bacterium]
MQVRTPVMAGNWKMNCDNAEAKALADGVTARAGQEERALVILCPPATALSTVEESIRNSRIKLGGQNMFWEEEGAYTGEVAAKMLLSCGCDYVIIGHSERRGRFGSVDEEDAEDLDAIFGDIDSTVNRKIHAALDGGLRPIVCVGELLSERQAGNTDEVVEGQVGAALDGVSAAGAAKVIIAYEPVWAIGTGEVCDADEANRVCGMIRQTVAGIYDPELAEGMQILYGGSVKPENVEGLMAQEHIDGGLVGGASLDAQSFGTLVQVAAASAE